MEKQFRFRIYPNKEQEMQIQKNFGCVRFVYNYYLEKRIYAYQSEKRILSTNECGRDLTALKKESGYEWLAEADDNSLRYVLRDLDFAYKAFFRSLKQKNQSTGFPKFKSKRETRQSYKSKNNIVRQSVEVYENKIKLPKLGFVKCRMSRQIEGRILSATVIQVPSGKYFVSICCTDAQPKPFTKTNSKVEVHMGIKILVSLSDGQQFENIRAFEKSRKKMSRLHKKLSRKTKGSRNHEKARIKLARAHEKVANQRNDFLHKLTTKLVKEFDVICIRDELISEKIKSKKHLKYVADVGWGTLTQQLEYKSNWYGKEILRLDSPEVKPEKSA